MADPNRTDDPNAGRNEARDYRSSAKTQQNDGSDYASIPEGSVSDIAGEPAHEQDESLKNNDKGGRRH